jgi:hypothetical protein
MKEIRNFQLGFYAEISKCPEGASYELRLYGVLRRWDEKADPPGAQYP